MKGSTKLLSNICFILLSILLNTPLVDAMEKEGLRHRQVSHGSSSDSCLSRPLCEELAVPAAHSVYTMLQDLFIPVLAQTSAKEQREQNEIRAQNREAAKAGKAIRPVPLTTMDKFHIVYRTFVDNEQSTGEQAVYTKKDEAGFDKNTLNTMAKKLFEGLQIFGEPSTTPGESLYDRFVQGNITTVFGKVEFQRLLFEAVTDRPELERRQALMRQLVADEALFFRLQENLRLVAQAEDDIIGLWKEMDESESRFFDQVYWGSDRLDSCGLALRAKDFAFRYLKPALFASLPLLIFVGGHLLFTMSRNPFITIFDSIQKQSATVTGLVSTVMPPLKTACTLGASALEQLRDSNVVPDVSGAFALGVDELHLAALTQQCTVITDPEFNPLNITQKVENTLNYYASSFKPDWSIFDSATGFMHLAGTLFARAWELNLPAIIFLCTMGAVVGVSGYMAYSALDSAKVYSTASKSIIKKMQKLSDFFKATSALQDLECEQLLPEQNAIKRTLSDAFSWVRPETVDSDSAGTILANFKRLKKVKDNLISLLRTVGKIEALAGAAQFYKTHLHKASTTKSGTNYAQLCFAEYQGASSTGPYLKLTDFWHPLLPPSRVVTNDLTLGGHDASKAVITGPNGGGKSTLLKAIALAAQMALTLTFVPASAAALTPFTFIDICLNVVDKTGTESYFQATTRLAYELSVPMRLLHGYRGTDKCSLTIGDELFSGTKADPGEALLYEYTKAISSFDKSLVLLVTHYHDVTTLAKDNCNITNLQIQPAPKRKIVSGIFDGSNVLTVVESAGFSSEFCHAVDKRMALMKKTCSDDKRIPCTKFLERDSAPPSAVAAAVLRQEKIGQRKLAASSRCG